MPRRRPRRELRDRRAELRDPLAEVRDWLAVPDETGLVASSIAARFRDNAVPSVCMEPHVLLAINNARKGVDLLANSVRNRIHILSVTLITAL
jgi:hypothetical protein